MPELPDVQVFKEYLDATALHQTIEHVSVENKKVLKGISASKFEKELTGRTFEKSYRHGKYLFVETDAEKTLLLHFGMTGNLRYYKDDEKEPKHTRILIDFSNGYHLAYICQRMLGRVNVLEDTDQFLKEKNIGPDALKIEKEDFEKIIGGSNAMIKTTLMDQNKIAGIGNVYSDEILFQTGIHPRKKASGLNNKQLNALYDTTIEVCQAAIKNKADPKKFPDTYLTPLRKEGEDCPACDGTIQTGKINNRTAYFCPSHQPE